MILASFLILANRPVRGMKNSMFIYVMDETSRDVLLTKGMKLLCADEKRKLWCFEAPEDVIMFSDLEVPHVISSVMTF